MELIKNILAGLGAVSLTVFIGAVFLILLIPHDIEDALSVEKEEC